MVSYSDANVGFFTLASFLFGWSLSSMNNLSDHITLAFQWCGDGHTLGCAAETAHRSWILTLLFAGATVGALCCGFFLKWGRRFSLAVAFTFYVIGGALSGYAAGISTTALYLGRFLNGMAVGMTTVVVPTYISEMVPANVRGSRGVLNQLLVTVGILAGTAVGALVSTIPKQLSPGYSITAWDLHVIRLALSIPAIVGVICLILQATVFVFDSPAYYVTINETAKAARVLQKIHETDDVEMKLKDIVLVNEENRALSESAEGMFALFSSPNSKVYIWLLVFGGVLSIGQQVTGINVFVTMSSDIFKAAGMPPDWSFYSTIIVASVNTLMTFPAMMVDRFGRRGILLFMVLGQTIFLSLYPIVSVIPGLSQSVVQNFSLVSVVGFILCFAAGYGPILWLYLPEIYPPEIRAYGAGLATALNWLFGSATVYFGSVVTSNFVRFVVFAALSALYTVWIFAFMKETKGLSFSPYMPAKTSRSNKGSNESAGLLV